MNLKEAQEVMRGERSYNPPDSEEAQREVATMAAANAHLAEEAYWVLRAFREGLAFDDVENFKGGDVTD